jgi:D-alanyl-D-alanine carboxypeptidase
MKKSLLQKSQKKRTKKFITKKQVEAVVSLSMQKTETVTSAKIQQNQRSFFYRYENPLLFGAILGILLLLFLSLVLTNVILVLRTRQQEIQTAPSLPAVSFAAYPQVHVLTQPVLSAKTAIALDRDSQVVLFEKNARIRFSTASTAKIMTALVALDHYALDDVLRIQTAYVEGSGLRFQVGEQFRFEDLLYAMLLPSANDAAVALADNYPGGKVAFVAKMNEKAEQLHLSDTHFIDPIGIEDDGDYTTALDLARLATVASHDVIFSRITGTQNKLITNRAFTRSYPLQNLNKLLGYNGVIGMKTGTTEGAGEVLVTSAIINNHPVIIIVMNSTQRFIDTQMLLEFIKENVSYVALQ